MLLRDLVEHLADLPAYISCGFQPIRPSGQELRNVARAYRGRRESVSEVRPCLPHEHGVVRWGRSGPARLSRHHPQPGGCQGGSTAGVSGELRARSRTAGLPGTRQQVWIHGDEWKQAFRYPCHVISGRQQKLASDLVRSHLPTTPTRAHTMNGQFRRSQDARQPHRPPPPEACGPGSRPREEPPNWGRDAFTELG